MSENLKSVFFKKKASMFEEASQLNTRTDDEDDVNFPSVLFAIYTKCNYGLFSQVNYSTINEGITVN